MRQLFISARALLALALVCGMFAGQTLVTASPVSAAPYSDTVRVTISRVDALSCFDPTLGITCGSGADFYPQVTIDGQQFGDDSMQIKDSDHITPNWQFSKQEDLSKGRIHVTIEIDDSDGAFRFGDDQADLVPGSGQNVELDVNLAPCGLTGSVTSDCTANNTLTDSGTQTTQGNDGDIAKIQFKVEVLDNDTDGDGLLDGWEVHGLDVNGDGVVDVDLPSMGADPRRHDLFVEVDCMVATDHSHCPQSGAMNDVVQAFANAPVVNPDGTTGVQLHLDTGTLFGSNVTPVNGNNGVVGTFGNMGGGGDKIPEAGNTIVDWDGATGNPATSFYSLKKMDPNRRFAFRYALFDHQTNARAASNDCTSGWAEGIPGNDFMVSLGGTDGSGNPCWTTDANGFSVGSRAEQAGTFMHELGHTLGLHHGGTDDINTKPNYLSVMNYGYQKCSVVATGTVLPGGCDYSRQALPTLDERLNLSGNPPLTGLDECKGFDSGVFGFGSVDWNKDGNTTGVSCSPSSANVTADINGDNGCVGAGTNGKLDTAATGDDVVVGAEVTDGPDRTCQTTATGDDSQDNAVGYVEPSPLVGANDWANIVWQFQNNPDFANGVSSPDPDEANPQILAAAHAALEADFAADLSVDVSGPAGATPGDTVTYTATVTDRGPGQAENVSVANTAPDGTLTTVPLGSLAVNGVATRTVSYVVPCTAPDGSVLTDSATVSGNDILGDADAKTANNTDSQTTTVHAPVLTVTKTATPAVNAGEAITYRITYANTGSAPSTGTVITDVLPADVYYSPALDQGAGPRPGSVTRNADGTTTLTWTIGAVPASSGPLTITYTARPSLLFLGGASVTNGVTLTYGNANGCTYAPVRAAAPTGITVVTPTRNPLSLGYFKTHPAEWTAEFLARIQATDQRFDGADGSTPNGVLSAAEVLAVLSGTGQPGTLRAQLLATDFNLAERRINAGTAILSPTDTLLGLVNVRDADRYAMTTLALPFGSNGARYSNSTKSLDEINNNRSEHY